MLLVPLNKALPTTTCCERTNVVVDHVLHRHTYLLVECFVIVHYVTARYVGALNLFPIRQRSPNDEPVQDVLILMHLVGTASLSVQLGRVDVPFPIAALLTHQTDRSELATVTVPP